MPKSRRSFDESKQQPFFRAPEEVSETVYENFNRHARQLEPIRSRTENELSFPPVIPTFAHQIIRQEPISADKLVELKEVIEEAGTESITYLALGGEITLDWIKDCLQSEKAA
jgi:hypothetical protein